MKLFLRALLFFISVVIFQATLTTFFVTGIITRNNEAHARVELEKEAKIVYENYNSWVHALWKTIITIKEDESVKAFFENPMGDSFPAALDSRLEEILLSSGMDSLLLKTQFGLVNKTVPFGQVYFSRNDVAWMKPVKDHPYIQLQEINGDLYLTAVLPFPDASGETGMLDIQVLKRLDDRFFRHLPVQELSVVLTLSGNLENSTSPREEVLFNEIMNPLFKDIPYREVYNLEFERGSYNAAFQKIGRIQKIDGEEELVLIVLMSNKPYLSILSKVKETVLYVSFIVGLGAILLSLYFSGRIIQPVNKLTAAMQGIREGNYDIKIPYKSSNEVGRLIQGFNEMAGQLNQDKETMNSYIQEITFLKDYNEKIIHSLQAGIVVLGSELHIEKVNSFFLNCFKKEESEILGKPIGNIGIDIICSLVLKNVKEVLTGKKSFWTTVKRTDTRVYEIKLYPLHTINSAAEGKCLLEINDVSRKYELEGKIIQAEKLSSISILSAGVSHEINNPLSSIMTNVQNLLTEETDKDKLTTLTWIEQETRRIAKIVRELLDFSAPEPDEGKGVLVNSCISDIIKLINYKLEKEGRIRIDTEFQENLPAAVISSTELKQVIINLVQNSIYAIEGSGEIYIKTELSKSGKKIQIRVKDSGRGIDKDVMLHIFDPFFTTRANGQGTGLGLSIIYGIINKYKGNIDVKSKEGFGTTFTLNIPVREDLCESRN